MRFIPGFASPPQAVVHALLPIEDILCEEGASYARDKRTVDARGERVSARSNSGLFWWVPIVTTIHSSSANALWT